MNDLFMIVGGEAVTTTVAIADESEDLPTQEKQP